VNVDAPLTLAEIANVTANAARPDSLALSLSEMMTEPCRLPDAGARCYWSCGVWLWLTESPPGVSQAVDYCYVGFGFGQ